MNLLADANWLIRLEREHKQGRQGPARKLLSVSRVFINPIAYCEFLSLGLTPARKTILAALSYVPSVNYEDATLASKLRFQRAKQGKALATPDALIAATALRQKLRLVTADKDFSGIPGLKWSGYRD
jgi:predicted nucleic acid-binding protein